MSGAEKPNGPPPTYHDLYITAPGIERTSIFDLPYGLEVRCNRVAGWMLWNRSYEEHRLIGGEYESPEQWIVLDVAGHVIVDSRQFDDKSGVADVNESEDGGGV